MSPSLRQLEYVVAVADTLNFREAAERCHVSQPALSSQLQQLERQLGVLIFERDRRHVLPTSVGKEIVMRARRVLEETRALVEYAKHREAPLSGTLHLGVIPTVAPYVLPRVLPRVRRDFPHLRMHLCEDVTERLLERMALGELDVVLLALIDDLGDVETMELFTDPFLLAVPPGHRLARRKRVHLKDLRDEEVLLLEEGHCLRNQALGLCDRAGATERGDFRASSLGTLMEMVRGGLGVTLLPSIAVDAEARTGRGLKTLPLPKEGNARHIGLAWRTTSSRGDEFRMLGEAIREALPPG